MCPNGPMYTTETKIENMIVIDGLYLLNMGLNDRAAKQILRRCTTTDTWGRGAIIQT